MSENPVNIDMERECPTFEEVNSFFEEEREGRLSPEEEFDFYDHIGLCDQCSKEVRALRMFDLALEVVATMAKSRS